MHGCRCNACVDGAAHDHGLRDVPRALPAGPLPDRTLTARELRALGAEAVGGLKPEVVDDLAARRARAAERKRQPWEPRPARAA